MLSSSLPASVGSSYTWCMDIHAGEAFLFYTHKIKINVKKKVEVEGGLGE